MKKLAFAAAGITAATALFSASAFATSPGAFAGGSNLYKVRNVTTNGTYSTDASATCGQTVKYSIELSNTDYGMITGITVKAPLSGDITVSGTSTENQSTTSTGKVNVAVDKGDLTYVAGSTQLLDVNGKALRTLADGITTNGTDAGALAGSTREFVQFQATVDCPTTPVTPVTPVTPTELPSTGAGDAILPAFAIAAAAGAGVYAIRSRKLAK